MKYLDLFETLHVEIFPISLINLDMMQMKHKSGI